VAELFAVVHNLAGVARIEAIQIVKETAKMIEVEPCQASGHGSRVFKRDDGTLDGGLYAGPIGRTPEDAIALAIAEERNAIEDLDAVRARHVRAIEVIGAIEVTT